ncbi:hypothetical protein ID866_2822 [Astraeus odoratus]|nr:hypothetical protein ID866_2822 [Astraeus odoratus]
MSLPRQRRIWRQVVTTFGISFTEGHILLASGNLLQRMWARCMTGFPLLSDDEFSSPDESEDEDEADEDSNAEEYYKNDYPDEASDSDEFRDSNGSDMFHEHSDADDISRCEDFGDDGDYL